MIATAIVLALVDYPLQTGRLGGPSSSAKLPTRAVLPFENRDAADGEYLAEGMTKELTGRLEKLSRLAVIARTSVLHDTKTRTTMDGSRGGGGSSLSVIS